MITGRWLAVLVGMMASSCYALEMARIQNPHGQDMTSSTLQWVDLQAGQSPPDNALPVTQDGPLWCRAKSRGTWSAGAVVNGKCQIPFLRKVLEESQYDVLVSINGSARIIEMGWDRLQAIPDHGIMTPNMLLAVDHSEDGEVFPGYVSYQERRAYMLKNGKAERQDKATVLTEDEPVQYVVTNVVRNEAKSQTTETEEVVDSTTLTNPDQSVQPVTEVLEYAAKEVLYWGRIRGTITGLKSRVMDPSGNEKEITWGIENELDHLETQMVEFNLPGETSVDVKLVAVMQKYEAPYSAKLTSIYSDGEKRQHPIAGLHIHVRLAELRADFSHPYFTENKTEISGEFMASQTLIHSTTTTTTTSTTPSSSSSSPDGEKPQSDSLATSEGSTNTRPVAEHMSDATSIRVSSLLSCLSFLILLFRNHNFPGVH